MKPDRDALAFAAAAAAVVIGAVLDSALVFAVLMFVVVIVAAFVLRRNGLTVALAIGLLWSNAIVVAGQTLGTPPALAMLPVVLLLSLLIGRFITGERELVVTPTFHILLAYGGILMISSLTSIDGHTPAELLMTFLPTGVVLWLLVLNTVDGAVVLDRAFLAMTVAGGAMGAVVLIQFLTSRYGTDFAGFAGLDQSETDLLAVDPTYQPRQSGAIGEKNRFAQVLVTTLPISVVAVRHAAGPLVPVTAVSAALILAGIALSGSRGALFGVAIVAVVLVLGGVLRLRNALIAVSAVLLVLLVVPSYWERVMSTVEVVLGADDLSSADSATLGRLTSNLAAIDMFLDHPLLGVGPGGYPPRYGEYAESVGLNVRDGMRQPHNLYLHVGSELGIFGLAALVGMIGLVLHRLRRASALTSDPLMNGRAIAMIGSVAAYAVTGVFLHLSYERFFWLMMALADATAVVALRSRNDAMSEPLRVSARRLAGG